MPYRKHKERILAGSLNLLPPSDITPPPDSLVLTNWRVDQAGNLRSRRGMNRLATGLVGTVHSLFRKGDNRYAGAGTALLYGTYLENNLASGFDGGPLGMVAYQDFVWVMNPGRQVKLYGSEVRNWGIAAPAVAPTVTAGSVVSTPVVGFVPAETWTVQRWIDGLMTENPSAEVILYNQGTIQVTQGSMNVQGMGTGWGPEFDGKWIRVHGPEQDVVTRVAVVSGAGVLTLGTNYDGASGSGYEYEIYDAAVESKQFLTVDGKTFLQLTCSPVGRWVLTHAFSAPKNLCISATPGTEEDDDQFRFWVWCEDREAIDSLKVTLLAGGRAVTCSIPPSILNPAKYTWNEISISRRFDPQRIVEANPDYGDLIRRMEEVLLDRETAMEWQVLNQQKQALYDEVVAKTPHFTELTTPEGSVYDFAWNAVTEVWFEVENNVPMVVNFDDALMVGGPDNTMEGEWRFAYTYANEDAFGHESNSSDWSEPVTLNKQAPTVVMTASVDPQVTQCHVYGIGGVLTEALRFGTRHANGGSFVVAPSQGALTVEDAQTAYITIPLDHDPAPAARGIAGPYFGRILAWSGNRLYWSKVAQPAYWPGADDPAEGNWVDVGEEGDDILAVTCHKRLAIIYKQRSIWRLLGDPDAADPEQTNANVGLLGERGIVNAGSVDYFAAAEGIYRFNGDYEEKVTLKVDPVFKGDWVRVHAAEQVKPIDGQYAGQSVAGFINGRLYFSYPETGQAAPNTTLVYDTEGQRWYRDSRGFRAIHYEGQGQRFVASTGANLYEVERETTDGGAAIPVAWQPAYADMGLPNNRKLFADLVIDYQSPGPLTVQMVYDNGDVEAAGTIQSTDRVTAIFPLGSELKGRRAIKAAPRITGNLTAEAVIYGVYLHWYAEARRAKTYDSGVTDLGTAQPKQFCEIEFDIEADGPVSWMLHTDLPGGLVAQRTTGNLTATGGRKTVPVSLVAQNIMGWRGRLFLSSAQEFQLHALRLRVLPIGEYIDGAQGDYWESVPL